MVNGVSTLKRMKTFIVYPPVTIHSFHLTDNPILISKMWIENILTEADSSFHVFCRKKNNNQWQISYRVSFVARVVPKQDLKSVPDRSFNFSVKFGEWKSVNLEFSFVRSNAYDAWIEWILTSSSVGLVMTTTGNFPVHPRVDWGKLYCWNCSRWLLWVYETSKLLLAASKLDVLWKFLRSCKEGFSSKFLRLSFLFLLR